MIGTFLVVAALAFGFLGLTWTKRDTFNLLLRVGLFAMGAWAVYLLARLP